ncbi:MAG: hypothetical protein AUJ72_05720 [Candidatus Omnitrophica bacterium CG1_02_46_14]|nr:MAG: hypothetical protein AUJ72_05720 [Candidatus Omnitrophica bacterium CG1_02_46_14]
MKMSILKKGFVFVVVFLFSSGLALANLEQIKLYKEAFPGEKPKCTTCHVDKMPKKDDGKHEWNEYGLKVKKVKEKPDVETYKTVGKNEAAE